jgi:beta-N-acetylhexosaminidase
VEGRGGGQSARRARRATERERRRAELRRRRLRALGAVAGVACILGAVVGAGAGDDEPSPAEAAIPAECAGSSPAAARRMAGQRLIVRSDGTPDSRLIERAREGEIAGVIVFPSLGDEEADITEGLKRLQRAAAAGGQRPLIVATDQEGGEVKRFTLAPPQRSPFQLGDFGDADDARLEGKATGSFLDRVGINTDLAPVLDVDAVPGSVMHYRAFGSDPKRVSALGLAFAAGLAKDGVLATAKHFPGLGRSTLNTDLSPSQIDASRVELMRDLLPFRDAIAQGIPLVMVGLATYPALKARDPAALEPKIVDGLLREQLGFEGVVITDDLEAGAVASSYSAQEAAVAAARAGNDLLLFAQDSAPDALGALARAITTARVDIAAARQSCLRIVELREGLRG